MKAMDQEIPINQILQGNALDRLRELPDECVHTVVTSPPYWGLRDYGTGKWTGGDPECDHVKSELRTGKGMEKLSKKYRGGGKKAAKVKEIQYSETCEKCGAIRKDEQLGLENTPEEFVEKLVAIFDEVWRVLRKDGTVWLNIGDSYFGGGGASGHTKNTENLGTKTNTYGAAKTGSRKHHSLKSKDLVGIPWMVAFALRSAGWYLRQEIIWHKPNPMPESVTDRCTKAHEQLFLLTKSPKYYFDQEAIKEPSKDPADDIRRISKATLEGKSTPSTKRNGIRKKVSAAIQPGQSAGTHRAEREDTQPSGKRNKRSVWTISTRPYKEAHFATFPPNLIAPCIEAGTSLYCCSKCNSPLHRIVEKELVPGPKACKKFVVDERDQNADKQDQGSNRAKDGHKSEWRYDLNTIGWEHSCACEDEDGLTSSGIVLDPFMGAGTTALVASKLQRKFIGIELNPEYIDIANKRLQNELGLFL